jgi:hypothetical protein
MFIQKCVLRRESIPILPCDCNECEWYISDSNYNHCFWVLAHYLDIQPGTKLSFEEIALLEGISQEEATKIFETALGKLRKESLRLTKVDIFDNVS